MVAAAPSPDFVSLVSAKDKPFPEDDIRNYLNFLKRKDEDLEDLINSINKRDLVNKFNNARKTAKDIWMGAANSIGSLIY